MNEDGKVKISKLVEALRPNGGTPIAGAYREAANKMTAGNALSNAKPSCSGNGIYFLTDGQPDPSSTNLFESEKVSDSELTDYWQRVAGKAQDLYNHAKLIKTATVGFGGEYYLSSDYAKMEILTVTFMTIQKRVCVYGAEK